MTGEVLYVSASSAKVFGYHPDELVGRNTFDLIHHEDRDKLGRVFQDVVARPFEPLRVEARVCRKDWRWSPVESTITNLLDESDVAAIVVNYRQIKIRRAALERKQLFLENRLSATKDFEDFAMAVEHDLREPVRTISMFTSCLVQEAHCDASLQKLAKLITDSTARMSTLLDGLRSYAVPGLTDLPRPFDLGPVVADVLRDLAAAIHASDAIVTVDPLPEVYGNPGQFLRVFQNLIMNAIKYRGDAQVRIAVSAAPLGSEWIIKVKDNGMGIAPEYHKYVFRPLKRLHSQKIPGSGLGLAVCKKIIEASGGKIWIESNPGEGAAFCFTIPAAAGRNTSLIPVRAPSRSAPPGGLPERQAAC